MENRKFKVEATVIGHLNFGIVEAKDESYVAQQVMKDAPRLTVSGHGIERYSLVVTEVKSEEIL